MDGLSRRKFLRLTAGAAAATGVACNSGLPKPRGAAAKAAGKRTLRIAQWGHFVPAYDDWFDNEYTQRWGEQHNVEVVVDHIPIAELSARADAEVATGRGHDIFGFSAPRPVLEDEVVDHREIVEEAEAKIGKMVPFAERSVFNPRTGKYFGFCDYWVPSPTHYRGDLWNQVQQGLKPDTWGDLLRAGPALKAMGHPLGVGISNDLDSDYALLALMHAYGSAVQDEEARLAINSPATVEAVKTGAAIYKAGETRDVFNWDSSSNNRFLASGQGSLILNAISAIRAVEQQDPELAGKILLAPTPGGPDGKGARGPYVMGVYVIWKFAANQEAAKRFLVDLALGYREAFLRSEFYNLPAFPGAVPDLSQLVATDAAAKPPGKYALLAGAAAWSTNLGHPGHTNAAVDEVFNQSLVPKMFAAAALGEMSAEEAVKAAEEQMKPIFEKWRERGKI